MPTIAADPDGIFATVHEDDANRAAVVFVMNPGRGDVVARVAVPGVSAAVDLLDGTRVRAEGPGGALEARMPPRTVRMLAVVGDAV